MFDYKYLTRAHLKGFDKYKYSAIDTSPLSNYVMHPTWNFIVKFIPNNIAPNLITLVGFLLLVCAVLTLTILDYQVYSSGRPIDVAANAYTMPNWVFTMCGLLIFVGYHLDGIDGKQARKIGVSGPLGELFDHGLDSYVVFMIPYCLFSVFGRDEYSISSFRGFLIVMSVVLNFYVSHWEKYNTGTLYLPWGYDVSMWASSLLFIIAGVYGPGAYKFHVLPHVTFVQVFEVVVHCTGLFTTLPIAVYNVYLYRKSNKSSKRSLLEVLRPLWSILAASTAMIWWALHSPNDVTEADIRPFMFLYGTLFSHIANRLIIAEMSNTRCDLISPLVWPLLAGVALVVYQPSLEFLVLYALLVLSFAAYVHFGVCVVRQICNYYKISCFTVPKDKRKVK